MKPPPEIPIRMYTCGCGNGIESALVERVEQGGQAAVVVLPTLLCSYCARPMVPPPGTSYSIAARTPILDDEPPAPKA